MSLFSDTVFSAVATVVTVSLMLTLCPVHSAPAQLEAERETREAPVIADEALAAFNGLSITAIFLSHHPNFTTTDQSPLSSVRDNMCDLLAYHNILVASTQDDIDVNNDSSNSSATNITSSGESLDPETTTETEDPVAVLLRANIQNTCVWLNQMYNDSDPDFISGEEEMVSLPATCELEVLGLYCTMQRLAAIVQTARTAVQESIYETYNEGDMLPLDTRYREWIDNNVPELISELQMFYF